MSRYALYKKIILEAKPCPDGDSTRACASCLADHLARIESNKCWYCHQARATRALKLFLSTHDLVHLVCENCAEAMHEERVTFIRLEGQI
jgi:ribosomal protein S27AE